MAAVSFYYQLLIALSVSQKLPPRDSSGLPQELPPQAVINMMPNSLATAKASLGFFTTDLWSTTNWHG
jgi:hypothetical protein